MRRARKVKEGQVAKVRLPLSQLWPCGVRGSVRREGFASKGSHAALELPDLRLVPILLDPQLSVLLRKFLDIVVELRELPGGVRGVGLELDAGTVILRGRQGGAVAEEELLPHVEPPHARLREDQTGILDVVGVAVPEGEGRSVDVNGQLAPARGGYTSHTIDDDNSKNSIEQRTMHVTE
eukprot:760432-Hanusia_phi.AAC.4